MATMNTSVVITTLKELEEGMGKELVSVEFSGETIIKLTFLPKMATPEAMAELFKNIDKL